MNSSKKAGAVLALALLAGWGCSDFLNGPGLTENPNNPLVATPIQVLVSVQANMATRLAGQLARCASVFTQQLIGSNNQQLQWCTAYLVGESDISGQMSGFYTGGGLYGIRQVEAAAQTAGDNQLLGEAKILEGLMMGTATSVWGDLPYTEALTPGIDSPKLDSQQSLYAAVQTRLDEGIAALTTVLASATGNCSTLEGDVIYCSAAGSRATELQRWIRAAHTLKARFHLHLVERNDTVRLRNYFDINSQGQYVGANQDNVTVRPAGCPAPPAACAPSVVNTLVRRQFTFRQPLVTWAENQLILAEARFMTGDSAGGAANVNAVRTAVGLPALAAPTFNDVMTEKYIAQYQNIDVWSDYKRTCIPKLTPNGTNPEVIGRLPYGSAERTANANIPLPSAYPTGTTGSSPVRNWDDPTACP